MERWGFPDQRGEKHRALEDEITRMGRTPETIEQTFETVAREHESKVLAAGLGERQQSTSYRSSEIAWLILGHAATASR